LSIDNQFDHLIINFPFVMQNDWKTANFARLYIIRILQHFATKLRNITNFVMLISSCDEIFVQAYLDQNFTHKGKGLFRCSALTNWATLSSCRALTTRSCIYTTKGDSMVRWDLSESLYGCIFSQVLLVRSNIWMYSIYTILIRHFLGAEVL
jgi:hypothetical protein